MPWRDSGQNNISAMAHIKRHLRDTLKDRADILAAYLFGSVLSGHLRSDSDIDIALLPAGRETIPLMDRLQLAAQLEMCCHRPVDIGVITPQNLVYASEAILKGQRLILGDEEVVATAEY